MPAQNRYEEEFEVTAHMTDADDVCRASEILRFLQEAANRQLEHFGPTAAQLYEQKRAFFLSRISIDIERPLHAYDRVLANSWPCTSSHGAVFDRDYALFHKTPDRVIPAASAVSQWALVDVDTRKLLRVEDSEIFYACADTVSVSIPLRFRIPKDAVLEDAGKKEILYSDVDKNRHMNNTHYPDLYCDRLPMDGMRVASFAIVFLKEAPLGETIRVTRTISPDENGLYYFRTYRTSDGLVNTEAAIRLTPIAQTAE